jgi:hypothetical protein
MLSNCYQNTASRHSDCRPKKISGLLHPFKDVLGLNLQTYSAPLASAAEFTCSTWAAAPTTNCKPQGVSDHMVEPAEPNESSANAVVNVTILVCTVQNIVARLRLAEAAKLNAIVKGVQDPSHEDKKD